MGSPSSPPLCGFLASASGASLSGEPEASRGLLVSQSRISANEGSAEERRQDLSSASRRERSRPAGNVEELPAGLSLPLPRARSPAAVASFFENCPAGMLPVSRLGPGTLADDSLRTGSGRDGRSSLSPIEAVLSPPAGSEDPLRSDRRENFRRSAGRGIETPPSGSARPNEGFPRATSGIGRGRRLRVTSSSEGSGGVDRADGGLGGSAAVRAELAEGNCRGWNPRSIEEKPLLTSSPLVLPRKDRLAAPPNDSPGAGGGAAAALPRNEPEFDEGRFNVARRGIDASEPRSTRISVRGGAPPDLPDGGPPAPRSAAGQASASAVDPRNVNQARGRRKPGRVVMLMLVPPRFLPIAMEGAA